MKLNKEVHATALPNVRFERAGHSLMGWMRAIGNDILQRVERALQADVPSLSRIDVEAYVDVADSGNLGRKGFDARLESLHDGQALLLGEFLLQLKLHNVFDLHILNDLVTLQTQKILRAQRPFACLRHHKNTKTP